MPAPSICVHKIALDLNNVQATYCARAAGTARFAYNWALREWQDWYRARKADPSLPAPSEVVLRKQLNAIKREWYPWMLEVTKSAPQQAIKNLGAAFGRFFKGQGKYPRFKKKGIHDSFRADNGPGTVQVEGRRLKIPRLGWVRMREALRFHGTIQSATVSCRAGRWYVALAVKMPVEAGETTAAKEEVSRISGIGETQASAMLRPCVTGLEAAPRVAGVDLGVKALATVHDGEGTAVVPGSKALRRHLKRLRRLSRRHARKVRGSRNRRKSARGLARLHTRIAHVRADGLHKLTTWLVVRHDGLVIEDLNVRGMLGNRHLARAIADMGFGEFRRQLAYKAQALGRTVIVADRWYASSKTCSTCGTVHAGLKLHHREWACAGCGTVHDRDENAAKNLRALAFGGEAVLKMDTVGEALAEPAAHGAADARGEEGSGRAPGGTVQPRLGEAGTERQLCSRMSKVA